MTLTFCSPLIFHRFRKSKLSRSPNYHPSFTLQAQVLPKCGRRERALDSQRNPCTNCQQLLDPPGLRMEALHLQAVSSLKKSDQKRWMESEACQLSRFWWVFWALKFMMSEVLPQKKTCFFSCFSELRTASKSLFPGRSTLMFPVFECFCAANMCRRARKVLVLSKLGEPANLWWSTKMLRSYVKLVDRCWSHHVKGKLTYYIYLIHPWFLPNFHHIGFRCKGLFYKGWL